MSRNNIFDPRIDRGRNVGPMFWGASKTILTGSYTIGVQAGTVHVLDGGVADRDVFLPPTVAGGGQVYVVGNVGLTKNLLVRNSGGILKQTIPAGDGTMFISTPDGDWFTGLSSFETGPDTNFHLVDPHDPMFGAVGDSNIDDTAALQEAIFYAWQNNLAGIQLREGFFYRITKPLYLDSPNNYPPGGDPTLYNPSDFQFTLALIGGSALGQDFNWGNPIIYADDGAFGFHDYPALVVGPGQGCRVAGVTIKGLQGSLWPTTYGPNSIGIAISGGPGGASRTLIERCWITKHRAGIKTGWNQDSLADQTTLFKSMINDCYYGFWVANTQNYINELFSCSMFNCLYSVYSPKGKAVNIYGGNFSCARGSTDQFFTISAVSALSFVAGQTGFTCTLTIPGSIGAFSENALTDGGSTPLYNALGIETVSFGVVPLTILDYNSTTNVIQLLVSFDWTLGHFGFDFDHTLHNDLQAEIQAATTLMCCQQAHVFYGTGINVYAIHVENASMCTCLVKTRADFNGAQSSRIENVYWNADPTDLPSMQGKIQAVWPIIDATNSDVELVGHWIGYNYEFTNPSGLFQLGNGNNDILFNQLQSIWSPNIRVCHNGNSIDNTGATYMSRGRGGGKFSYYPFMPHTSLSGGGESGAGLGWVTTGRGQFKAWGFVPAPGEIPEMSPTFMDIVEVTPVVTDKGRYPPICGQVTYRVVDWDTGVDRGSLYAVSDHEFFSYGQNLAVTWRYKGQSPCLYVDDVTWFFAGLKIGLDNGSGIEWYIVTGVYKPLGYVTCVRAQQQQGIDVLQGIKTTTYNGTVIYQENYSWKRYGNTQAAFEIVITGGAGAITSGIKVHAFKVPFSCLITKVSMYGDQVGSVVVDIWKDSYANYPPTVADSIVGGAPPTIAADIKMEDSTLTGWNKTLNEGDVLRINLNSVSTFQSLTIALEVSRR